MTKVTIELPDVLKCRIGGKRSNAFYAEIETAKVPAESYIWLLAHGLKQKSNDGYAGENEAEFAKHAEKDTKALIARIYAGQLSVRAESGDPVAQRCRTIAQRKVYAAFLYQPKSKTWIVKADKRPTTKEHIDKLVAELAAKPEVAKIAKQQLKDEAMLAAA